MQKNRSNNGILYESKSSQLAECAQKRYFFLPSGKPNNYFFPASFLQLSALGSGKKTEGKSDEYWRKKCNFLNYFSQNLVGLSIPSGAGA